MNNQNIGFTTHATERFFGRFAGYLPYIEKVLEMEVERYLTFALDDAKPITNITPELRQAFPNSEYYSFKRITFVIRNQSVVTILCGKPKLKNQSRQRKNKQVFFDSRRNQNRMNYGYRRRLEDIRTREAMYDEDAYEIIAA